MKKVLLVGNANTGKTTLLNTLTKSSEHTGNWHGVTVEEKEKFFVFEKEKFSVVDLPGIYSLNSLSFEEQVSVDYLFQNQYDLIVNTCDINTLRKNLFLTLDLLLSGKTNLVIFVNDFGKKDSYDFLKNISQFLGVDVLVGDFSNKQDIQKLKKYIKNYQKKENKINFYENIFSLKTKQEISIISNIDKSLKINEILKIIEKNNFFIKKINKNDDLLNFFENKIKINYRNLIQEKYNFIDKILKNNKKNKNYGQEFLDKIILNKFLAVPIFFIIMSGIFYLTFFSVGAWLSDLLSYLVQDLLGGVVMTWLNKVCSVPWVIGLVQDGVFGGVGSLVSFLPQVVLLFLCLALMEETGYFARVAFVFEDVFSSLGLSGKSIYTLLMGFGCNASAVLTARALDNKNAKIKTAIITPYMSCSAKLPVFAILGGAFFGANNIFVIFLLYLLGVFTALLVSVFLEKFFLKSSQKYFLMEFVPYRFPKLKKIFSLTFDNMKLFLVKVTTIFVSVNVIVWCLSNFDFSLHYINTSAQISILQALGQFFAPIFAPLGFDNWGAVGALIAGIIAKEVIVSSLAIFNGLTGDVNNFSQISKSFSSSSSAVSFSCASAMSYLTFCMLYCPCLATMVVMKKEIGWKWTLFAVLTQLVVAYLMAFMVFNLYKLSMVIGLINVALIVLCGLLILFAFFRIIDHIKDKTKCTKCGKCNY